MLSKHFQYIVEVQKQAHQGVEGLLVIASCVAVGALLFYALYIAAADTQNRAATPYAIPLFRVQDS